jgi:hypothetical protein
MLLRKIDVRDIKRAAHVRNQGRKNENMGDEGHVKDMEGEWSEFLEKFHADSEQAKQRIRKVNKNIIL